VPDQRQRPHGDTAATPDDYPALNAWLFAVIGVLVIAAGFTYEDLVVRILALAFGGFGVAMAIWRLSRR
jgi:hypothetical protein